MKQLLFTLLLLSSSVTLMGQSVRFGAPYEVFKDGKYSTAFSQGLLIDTVHQTLIAVKKKQKLFAVKGKIHVQTFDLNTLEERVRHSTEPTNHIDRAFRFINLSQRFYLFYKGKIGSMKDNMFQPIMAQELDPVSGELKGEATTLCSDKDHFFRDIILTPDQTKALAWSTPVANFDNQRPFSMAFKLFDENLESNEGLVTCTFPYPKKVVSIKNVVVDNDHTAYVLGKVYLNNKAEQVDFNILFVNVKGAYKPTYMLHLFKINLKDGSYVDIPLKLGKRFPRKCNVRLNSKNQLVLAGYYTTIGETKIDPDGVFCVHLDTNGNVLQKTYHEIPVDLLTLYERPSTQNRKLREDTKNNAVMDDLELRAITFQSDGSTIIHGTVYPCSRVVVEGRSYITCVSKSILVTKINPDGSLGWMNKIFKKQDAGAMRYIVRSRIGSYSGTAHRFSDEFISAYHGHSYFTTPGKHHYLYMNNLYDVPEEKFYQIRSHEPFNFGGLFLTTIDDATGAMERKLIIDKYKNPYSYRLNGFLSTNIVPLPNGKALIEFYTKTKENILMEIDVLNVE